IQKQKTLCIRFHFGRIGRSKVCIKVTVSGLDRIRTKYRSSDFSGMVPGVTEYLRYGTRKALAKPRPTIISFSPEQERLGRIANQQHTMRRGSLIKIKVIR